MQFSYLFAIASFLSESLDVYKRQVFHSLRHSSITYKLKLNGGDMKSVQGDSGHAQVKMVADVYSHIIDEDRCIKMCIRDRTISMPTER